MSLLVIVTATEHQKCRNWGWGEVRWGRVGWSVKLHVTAWDGWEPQWTWIRHLSPSQLWTEASHTHSVGWHLHFSHLSTTTLAHC